MLERVVGLADDLASIEVGGRLFMIKAAALEQDDAATARKEPAGRGLASRPRSDDRNVGRYRFRRLYRAIDPHLPPVIRQYNGERPA